jgi:hypothetical protein
MASSSVVVLEPGGKGCGSLVVVGEGLPVGPFGGQGPVEPLDLAVLPGAVRFDEHLAGAEGGADLTQGPLVGPGVVSHDSFDPVDAPGGEVGRGAGQEASAGRAFSSGWISE